MAKEKKKRAAASATGRKRRGATPPSAPKKAAAPQPAPQRRRAAGGVPPLEAFDDIRRRPPPDLPGPAQPEAARQQPPRGRAVALPREEEPPGEAPKRKRAQKRVNPAKRRRRRRVTAVVVLAALVAVGIWLSFTLLFKISGFELQGEAPYPYSVEEVAGVFGLEPGDNMFGFSASGAEKRIETALPYIEEVSVRRKLPSTIVFRVVQAREAYCLPADGGFAVLSDKMKVLRTSEAAVDGLMVINGLGNLIAEVGQPLALDEAGAEAVASAAAVAASAAAAMSTAPQSVPPESAPAESEAPASDAAGDQSQPGAENSEAPPVSVAPAPPVQQRPETTQDPAASFEAMQALLAALAEVGFTEVEAIDVADALDLEMHWGGRITVQLGPKSGLVEKLATALVLLTDDGQDLVAESDKGILDMRYYLDTGQAYFRPQ